MPWWIFFIPIPKGISIYTVERSNELQAKEQRLALLEKEAGELAAMVSAHCRVASNQSRDRLLDQLIQFDSKLRDPREAVKPMTGRCCDCGGAISAGHYICDICLGRRS